MSFIGIAINIWRNTRGTGGAGSTPILQRDNAVIFQRNGAAIYPRIQSNTVNPLLFFDGDSLSIWSPATWPNQFNNLTDNAGIRGDYAVTGSQIADMVTRATVNPAYDNFYTSTRSCVLFALCGINNLIAGSTATTAYTQYAAYHLARKTLGFVNFAFTLPSCNPAFVSSAVRLSYNSQVRSGYTSFATGLIDLENNPLIGSVSAWSDATYFVDGLHMTTAGYGVVATAAFSVAAPYV